jgi:hypothetical protein
VTERTSNPMAQAAETQTLTLADFILARYDEHIARCWERGLAPGSAFVRDEYEALRRVVEWHTAAEECCETRWGPMRFDADPTVSVGTDSWGGLVTRRSIGHQVRLGCVTLMLLAQPYAGHPGYRQEWKP